MVRKPDIAHRRPLALRDEAARAAGGKRQGDRSADIVRLLLLTGARRGEVLAARWGQFNLREGTWTKPASATKQKLEHNVPLSAPARKLLAEMRARLDQPTDDEMVFPGRGTDAPQTTLKKSWYAITDRATVVLFAGRPGTPEGKLLADLRHSLDRDPTMREMQDAAAALGVKLPAGLRDFRAHDLRHSYASFLASAGLSLPTIGALLGHSQPATTARYAHLFDDPLGVFGGMLPLLTTAIVAATGNIYNGLWYPIAVAVMTATVGGLFLRDTKDIDITVESDVEAAQHA